MFSFCLTYVPEYSDMNTGIGIMNVIENSKIYLDDISIMERGNGLNTMDATR